MDKKEAMYIMSEIHSIDRYVGIMQHIQDKLARVSQDLEDLASPQSPNSGQEIEPMTFNKDGSIRSMGSQYKAPGGNPVLLSTRINELLSEEQEYIESYNKVKQRHDIAVSYRKQVIAQTGNDAFMVEFMDKVPYRKLKNKYAYENPYRIMIGKLKQLEIKI